jgi:hypothetical protein
MSNTWIVVGDARRARCFSADRTAGIWREIGIRSNPQARLHGGDPVSEKSSRDGGRKGSLHGFDNAKSAREGIADRFAGEVCTRFGNGRQRKVFSTLDVIGRGRLLRVLRRHRDAALLNRISDGISNYLTTEARERVRIRLPEYP